MTRPWRTLATAPTDEGTLELRARGDTDFLIVIGGRVLMTSVGHRSEQALATLACAKLRRPAPRVLLAGLGMGFTLRAALDTLPAGARVTVAELHQAVIDWGRGPLAPLTRGALDDPRVEVVAGDVADLIAAASGTYDAILLDLYEGPYAGLTQEDPHFGPTALARARTALVPGGVLAVWSEDPCPPFVRLLTAAGFEPSTHSEGHGGRVHIIYLGIVTGAPPAPDRGG